MFPLGKRVVVTGAHLSRVVRGADYKAVSTDLARRVALALGLPEDYFPEYREGVVIERVKTDPHYRDRLYLWLVIVLAALVRFPTLGLQSFWDDEGYTVRLMRMSLPSMIRAVPQSESTPPPYYVLSWVWSRLFGISEWGLRSFSALCGTALVAVAYLTASRLGSKPAGILAALLVATNPLLIWYSQEARVYAMLSVVAGLSLLTFLMAMDGKSRRVTSWWCASAAAALCTHYFALFLVAPEAFILLYRRRDRRTIVAVAIVIAVGAALLPLALVQRNRGYSFLSLPLRTRILQIPEQFLVGYGIWYTTLGKLAALVVAAASAYGLFQLRRRRTRSTLAVLAVTLTSFLLPIILVGSGLDYVATLYFIALVGPVMILISAGLSRKQGVGVLAAVAVAAVGLSIVAVVDTHPQFQREDLRGAAHLIDRDPLPKTIVITPPSVLSAYIPTLHTYDGAHFVREVVLVAMAQKKPGMPPSVPRSFDHQLPIAGFHLVQVFDGQRFTLVRFRAAHPELVLGSELAASAIKGGATDTSVEYEP